MIMDSLEREASVGFVFDKSLDAPIMGAPSSNRAIVCVCQWEQYYWRVGHCWRDWKGVDD